MFADTITLPINGSDRVLTRVNQDGFSSIYRYRTTNLNIDVAIRHSTRLEKGNTVNTDRHNVEIVTTEFTVTGGITTSKKHRAYLVFEMPASDGYGEIVDLTASLRDSFMDSPQIIKLVNWES